MYPLQMELHTPCKLNACKLIWFKYNESIFNVNIYITSNLEKFLIKIYYMITELIVLQLVDQEPDKIIHQPSVEQTLESIVSLFYL